MAVIAEKHRRVEVVNAFKTGKTLTFSFLVRLSIARALVPRDESQCGQPLVTVCVAL